MATSPNSPITDFSRDVLGHFICNGFDEMERASDPNPRPDLGRPEARPYARPFDIIEIGGSTFGAAIAEHLWFRSTVTQTVASYGYTQLRRGHRSVHDSF